MEEQHRTFAGKVWTALHQRPPGILPVSLHYEWILSLRLRPDVPEAFLAELRYHLGQSGQVPRDPGLDCDTPALAGPGEGGLLPGGPVARLTRAELGRATPAVWEVFVRTFVRDDAMYDLVQIVPSWLARWSLTEGWIGFARERLGLDPWLNFYALQGHAYAASPGEAPVPLQQDTPPFTATQTTERWPLSPDTPPR